ncbi:MAG: AfsR/SARP family transcriptional regulator [Jatrophihabitantaceae bacterium]
MGGPQIRALLALLLVRPGHVMSLSTLVASLWSRDAPPSAERTARTYMSRLRLALAPVAGQTRPGSLIVTTPPGYLLRADPLSVDASLFEELALTGRRALSRDDPVTARAHLLNALRLWRGDAYGEFADIPVLRAEAIRLEELRLSAVENRLQSELRIGMGSDLVAELDGLVAAHPLRERLWVQFMIALYRSGRQAEALSAYQRARALLADELGLEPSVELADTHRRILAQDPKLLPALAAVVSATPALVTAVQDRPATQLDELEPDQNGSRHDAAPWVEPGLSSAERADSLGAGRICADSLGAGRIGADSLGAEGAGLLGAAGAVPDAPTERRIAAEQEERRSAPAWFERVPGEVRPAAAVIAEALSQPCVRALIGTVGRGLMAFGRGVAGLASAISSRVRGWWGWGTNESLANMK